MLRTFCRSVLTYANRYMEKHPEADKMHLVRLISSMRASFQIHRCQLRGAAEGLSYLHQVGIVHGNSELRIFVSAVHTR
jgi:hypothetical protein